jgi:hypothetical protein
MRIDYIVLTDDQAGGEVPNVRWHLAEWLERLTVNAKVATIISGI